MIAKGKGANFRVLFFVPFFFVSTDRSFLPFVFAFADQRLKQEGGRKGGRAEGRIDRNHRTTTLF